MVYPCPDKRGEEHIIVAGSRSFHTCLPQPSSGLESIFTLEAFAYSLPPEGHGLYPSRNVSSSSAEVHHATLLYTKIIITKGFTSKILLKFGGKLGGL
jgi:hypothetical protein